MNKASKGWISLHRKIIDNPVLQIGKNKKHYGETYYGAFTKILLEVNHTSADVPRYSDIIHLERGQSCNTYDTWKKLFGWKSNSTVETFFNKLIEHKIIELKTVQQGIILTVCNYSSYQDAETKNSTNSVQTQHVDSSEIVLNNNDNNVNNGNNIQHVNMLEQSSTAKRKKKVVSQQYDISAYTGETKEDGITVPTGMKLSNTANELLKKVNKKSKVISTAPKKVKAVDKLVEIADRIYSVMQLTMIAGLESIYKPMVDFDWYNAAKKLSDTVKDDERYTEFEIMIEKKTDSAELNLLYHIIKECKSVENLHNFLSSDDSIELNDAVIYSMLFKERIYEANMNKLLKDYRLKLNQTFNQLEKEKYLNIDYK